MAKRCVANMDRQLQDGQYTPHPYMSCTHVANEKHSYIAPPSSLTDYQSTQTHLCTFWELLKRPRMANHHPLLSALPQPSPTTYGASLSVQTRAKNLLSMSSNTNTSPLKRSKSTIPTPGARPKRLSTTSSLVKRGSIMMMGEFGGDGSGDEVMKCAAPSVCADHLV